MLALSNKVDEMKWMWKDKVWPVWMVAWLFVLVGLSHHEAGARRRQVVVNPAFVQIGPVQSPSPYVGQFRRLPKEERQRIEADTAHLKNGDKVSGVIEGITDGSLFLGSELLPEAVKIPLKNVDNILFKDREESGFERDAWAVALNGDCFGVTLKGCEGGEVVAETDFSAACRIKREHLAGVVFRREPRVIYRADFEGGDSSGFKCSGRKWDVSDGRFGPSDDSSWSGAYLKLRQEGRMRYMWRASEEKGRGMQSWFMFFAQDPDHNAPGNAYQVRTSAHSVYLYRTVQNNTQHLATFNLPIRKNSSQFEVDYDSRSGVIRLKADGDELTAGVFASPISRGDYIILAGRAKHSFDDIVVEQLTDAVLPATGEEADGKDCVFLTNGDRLSGRIVLISEGKVRMETGYCREPLEVPLDEVSAVRFSGAMAEDQELPVISLRNGDRLSGEVMWLEGGPLGLRSPYLGEIQVDVNDVASVVFPAEEGFFEQGQTANVEIGLPQRIPGIR